MRNAALNSDKKRMMASSTPPRVTVDASRLYTLQRPGYWRDWQRLIYAPKAPGTVRCSKCDSPCVYTLRALNLANLTMPNHQ